MYFYWESSNFGKSIYLPKPTRGAKTVLERPAPCPHAGYGPVLYLEFNLANVKKVSNTKVL